MLQERLIRLADDHSAIDSFDEASVSHSNEVADAIRELLSSASEIELIESLKFSLVKSWVAFYVLESPDAHSAQLVDAAFLEIKKIADGDSAKSIPAKEILKELNSS